MKKLTAIILTALTCITLTGCAPELDSDLMVPEPIMAIVDVGDTYYIYVDRDTRVMYISRNGYSGITVMVNADGTPKIWQEDL